MTDQLITDIANRLYDGGDTEIKRRIPQYKAVFRKSVFFDALVCLAVLVLLASVCALFMGAGYPDLFTVDDAVNVWETYIAVIVGWNVGVYLYRKRLIKHLTACAYED